MCIICLSRLRWHALAMAKAAAWRDGVVHWWCVVGNGTIRVARNTRLRRHGNVVARQPFYTRRKRGSARPAPREQNRQHEHKVHRAHRPAAHELFVARSRRFAIKRWWCVAIKRLRVS